MRSLAFKIIAVLFSFCYGVSAYAVSVSPTAPSKDTDGNYTVTWPAVNGQNDYSELFEQVGSGSWTKIGSISGTTAGSVSRSKNNGVYRYRVTYCDYNSGPYHYGPPYSCEDGPIRTTTVVKTPGTPGTASFSPSSLSCTSNFTVSWGAASGGNRYQIQESRNGGSYTTLSSTHSSRSYTRNSLPANTNYRYRIRARYTTNGQWSNYSGWRYSNTINKPACAPSVPTNLSSNEVISFDGSFVLSWNSVSGATSYKVKEVGGSTVTRTTNNYSISGKSTGEYNYQVQACNGSGCSSFSSSIKVTVQRVTALSLPPAVDPSNDALTGSVYKGKLPASYSVENDASFQYNVPIALPPGIAGIVPNLSLHYHSSRGNGLVGQSWALQGLGSIERCEATYVQDGYRSGINAGDDYRYCLNGERLVNIGGNEYRTQEESFARIEKLSTHWRVTYSNGTQNTFGQNSLARENDGSGDAMRWHLERVQDVFGNYYTVTYEAPSGNNHRPKHIDFTKNINANGTDHRVSFTYQNRNDILSQYEAGALRQTSQRLSRVVVTTEGSTVRSYELEYQIHNGTYHGKAYRDPLKTSRIASIQLCYASTSDCAEETEFDWTEQNEDLYRYQALDPATKDAQLAYYQQVSGSSHRPSLDINGDGVMEVFNDVDPLTTAKYTGIDVNGDGFDDIIRSDARDYVSVNGAPAKGGSPTNRGLEVYLSNGNNISSSPTPAYTIPKNALMTHSLLRYRTPLSAGSEWISEAGDLSYIVRFIDMNGDGLVDIVRSPRSTIHEEPTWTTTGSYVAQYDVSIAFNRGHEGVQGFTAFQTWLPDLRTHGMQYGIMNIVDVNGDGLPDLHVLPSINNNSDDKIALNDPQNQSFNYQGDWSNSDLSGLQGDFNGDGYQDYAQFFRPTHPTEHKITVALGTGTEFTNELIALDAPSSFADCSNNTGPGTPSCSFSVFDFNGDGMDDIIERRYRHTTPGCYNTCENDPTSIHHLYEMTAKVYLATGGSSSGHAAFAQGIVYNTADDVFGDSSRSYFHTLNGTGAQDYNRDGTLEDTFVQRNLLKKHLIQRVIELGKVVEVDYTAMTDPEVYTPQPESANTIGGNFRFVKTSTNGANYSRSAYVSKFLDRVAVKETRVSDGIGGMNRTTYEYSGAKIHGAGYGNLGFAKIEVTAYRENGQHTLTSSEYHQQGNTQYQLAGKLKRRIVQITDTQKGINNRVISNEENNWRIRDLRNNSSEPPHFHAYITESRNRSYSPDQNNTLLSTDIMRMHSSAHVIVTSKQKTCPGFSFWDVPRTDNVSPSHDAYGTLYNVATHQCDTFGIRGSHIRNASIQNNTSAWVLNMVGDVYTRQWEYTIDGNTLSTVDNHNRTIYNTSLGTVTQSIREPNDTTGRLKLTEDFLYNAYGSVREHKITADQFTNDGIASTPRKTIFTETFASNSERTLVTTNALNQQSTQVFDARFGSPKRVTDINGLVITSTFDSLGRVDAQTAPGNISTEFDYRTCSNCFSEHAKAVWYVQEKSTGKSAARMYYDDFDREIATQVRGLNGELTYKTSHFDRWGNTIRGSSPYRSSVDYSETQQDYDILNRSTRTTFDSGAIQSNTHGVIYDATSMVHTNSRGHTTTRRYDATNRVKSVEDALGTTVVFTHNALGHLSHVVVGQGSNIISHSITYDKLGRKISQTDPDAGTMTYVYNAFGEIAYEQNALGQQTRYEYDLLGRPVKRIDDATRSGSNTRTHTWTYDTATNGKGLLKQVQGYDTEGNIHRETYTYTSLSQPYEVTSFIDGSNYKQTFFYDGFQRAAAQRFPTGFTVLREYNGKGYLHKIHDAEASSNTAPLWEAQSDDARGNLTEFTYGNGDFTQRHFDKQTGLINTIQVVGDTGTLQDHRYIFDDEGNLCERHDFLWGVQQRFSYDALERLIQTDALNANCGSPSGATDYSYDIHGNITKKSHNGSTITDYAYGQNGAGKHAVTYANGQSYQYNAAGQMTQSGNRNINYSTFGKPTLISKPGYSTKVIYGALKTRIKRIDTEGSKVTNMIYAGNYEKITENGEVEHRHYVDQAIIHVINEEGKANVYQHRDHIGSLVVTSKHRPNPPVGEQEHKITNTAYEPWGMRLNRDWSGGILTPLTGAVLDAFTEHTERGFTDHEHLDGVGLIHMNGRVYDPVIGRFVSPDPLIQAPENTQSYNRYTYVWNNPLRYTDPTGYETAAQCGGDNKQKCPPTVSGDDSNNSSDNSNDTGNSSQTTDLTQTPETPSNDQDEMESSTVDDESTLEHVLVTHDPNQNGFDGTTENFEQFDEMLERKKCFGRMCRARQRSQDKKPSFIEQFLIDHGFASFSVRGGFILVGALDVIVTTEGVSVYLGAGLGAGFSITATVGAFAGADSSGFSTKTTVAGGFGIGGNASLRISEQGATGSAGLGTGLGASVSTTIGYKATIKEF